MPHDVQTLMHIWRIFLAIGAVCVTTFPVLYGLLSPWYKSHLGRSVFIQSFMVAVAIDISAYAQFWSITKDIHKILVINVVFLTALSLSSLYLTATLFYYNFTRKKEKLEHV